MKLAMLVVFALLVGCAAPRATAPQPQDGAMPARIDLARAVSRSPFAPMLAEYAADIATLRRAAHDGAFRNVHGQLDASAADVERRLNESASHVSGLRPQPIQAPTSEAAASRLDFNSSGAVGAFTQAAQSRVTRAVELRAAQLREHEATVAYDYERTHAGRRLVLGLKLRDLHLDAATRRRYQAQLDALDRQESARVEAERYRDAGILTGYASQLRARAASDSASMASDLAEHARTMGTIARPQMRALPNSLLHPVDNRASTVADFETARRDLTNRFYDLRALDDAANGDVAREIANLEHERDALRAQIIASIESRAARIAATQHLGRVYTRDAPIRARDLTDAVVRSYAATATGS